MTKLVRRIKNLYACAKCDSVFVGKDTITNHKCIPGDPKLFIGDVDAGPRF